MTSTTRATAVLSSLPIVSIECIPIRVPLGRVYQGSHYHMTHRSTVIVRVASEGIVGEAYAGDEDARCSRSSDRPDEIAPRLIGEDAFAVERCWELVRPATFDILRDRRLGLVASAASTRRSGTRSARCSVSRCGDSGAATATASR